LFRSCRYLHTFVFRNEIDFQSDRWRIDVEYIGALTTSAGLPNASIWIAFMAALSTDVEFALTH